MEHQNKIIKTALDDLFIERKFGIFIHWGLYSILGGRWNGKTTPYISEWIMLREQIPFKEYQTLASRFNPQDFDAEKWVELIARSGAKYMVVTAKHHEGFAMYHSKVSKYNIVDATPFGRDIIKELSDAARRHNIKFCLYYSHDQDWYDPNGFGNNWDYDPQKQDFNVYFERKVLPQVEELLTNYGEIGMIWFDTPFSIDKANSRRLVDFVHGLQPACLVSGRIGHDLGDFAELCDNGVPSTVVDTEWETPLTMNDSWGYKIDDANWKSAQTLVRYLSGIVGKGGNCLLNIGPDKDGNIPVQSIDNLNAIGRWLDKNGKAIYGTSHNPFSLDYNWGTLTCRDNRLYLHIHNFDDNKIVLKGLKNRVNAVTVDDRPIGFTQSDKNNEVLEIALNRSEQDFPLIVCIEAQGDIEVDNAIMQQGDNSVVLEASVAANLCEKSRLAINHIGATDNWIDTDELLGWKFRIDEPGTFDVSIVTIGARADGDPATPLEWEGGHQITINVADKSLSGTIVKQVEKNNPTNSHFPFYITNMGKVQIPRAGEYEVKIKADNVVAEKRLGFTFRSAVLSFVSQ